jgi:hypothetical protein
MVGNKEDAVEEASVAAGAEDGVPSAKATTDGPSDQTSTTEVSLIVGPVAQNLLHFKKLPPSQNQVCPSDHAADVGASLGACAGADRGTLIGTGAGGGPTVGAELSSNNVSNCCYPT